MIPTTRKFLKSTLIGFVIECALLVPIIVATRHTPIGDSLLVKSLVTAWVVTQEPGFHIALFIRHFMRLGFEEAALPLVYFMPFIQWYVYTVLTYVLLTYLEKKRRRKIPPQVSNTA